MVPSPSCPCPLYPDVYTLPKSSATAKVLFVLPDNIPPWNTPLPSSPNTLVNLVFVTVVPFAALPYSLYPAVHAEPSALIIDTTYALALMSIAFVIISPVVSFASTGNNFLVVFPIANCP